MKDSLRRLSAMLLVAGTLTIGCQAASGPTAERMPREQTGEPDKIRLETWIMSNTAIAERVFMETLHPFLEQRPDIEVDVKVLSWDEAWSSVMKAVSTGEGPDLLQLGTTWVPAFAAMDGLADLTERFEDDAAQNRGDYIPASWQTTMIGGRPNIYAVPWFVEARALLYRQSAFEAAGVDPDEAFANWDNFKAAIRQLQGVELDGRALSAISITGKNDWSVVHNLFPWVWSAGGEVLEPDLSAAAFNSDAAVEGIMFYTGLAHEGLVDPSSLQKTSTEVENDYADGKTAMVVTGSWVLRDLKVPRDEGGLAGLVDPSDVGVAPLPEGPKGRATFIGGSNLAIFKHADHPDEAWDVIAYLTSNEEAQLAYAQKLGVLPAQERLIHSPGLMDIPGYRAFAEATQYGRSYPSIPQWGPAETTLVKYCGLIWDLASGQAGEYGESAVRKLLDDAAREVNLLLAQGN